MILKTTVYQVDATSLVRVSIFSNKSIQKLFCTRRCETTNSVFYLHKILDHEKLLLSIGHVKNTWAVIPSYSVSIVWVTSYCCLGNCIRGRGCLFVCFGNRMIWMVLYQLVYTPFTIVVIIHDILFFGSKQVWIVEKEAAKRRSINFWWLG